MSNTNRRADFERALARRRLVESAIEKLYLGRGGASIDAQLRMYEVAISIATFSRDSDLELAKTGIFSR